MRPTGRALTCALSWPRCRMREASAAQVKSAEDLTGKIKALPRADALRAGPVARALALYAAEDEAAGA